ncbi:hypothetical protein [Serratia ureilytica]|uniref:MrpH family fimbial adhesin n=1 Tax=Serratia ureilytica TaxID=300181 RepID=UPI00313AFF0C
MKYLFFISMLFFSLQAKGSWELDAQYIPSLNQFKVKVIRWDTDDRTFNPLYGCYDPVSGSDRRCNLYIREDTATSHGDWFNESFYVREASDLRTVGEVAALFARKGYLNKEVYSHGVTQFRKNCFSLAYRAVTGALPSVPGGVMDCTRGEIIPTYCSIAEPYIELDHGTVSSNAINRQTVSSTLRASCNQNFKLAIIAQDGTGEVQLGGGLTSHLTVNGDDLSVGHMEVVGPEGKTFVISSTLSGSASDTGEFQGSKVIILSTP